MPKSMLVRIKYIYKRTQPHPLRSNLHGAQVESWQFSVPTYPFGAKLAHQDGRGIGHQD